MHAASRRTTSPATAASCTTPSGARSTRDVVIAWHGLARTGRDMDDIAAHLSQRFRVICPDTHRPRPEPVEPRAREREYCLAFYVQLAAALLDQLGLDRVHWLGTSMGGAIGTAARRPPPARPHPQAWC